ncbi:hypothetical protein TNCV_4559201 [Trichonephila clavipes]|nr:hypothetical protein TNCV_4559201 [Trichonephila clavipes]
MMLLKTYQELNAKYHTSNPSLVMTTNTAAADRQMNFGMPCKKDSVEDFVFPKKTARPASPSFSDPIATANSFSDLVEDQNKVNEVEEAKTTDIPKT